MAQDTQTPRWTLGIDLGDRKSHYCWVDEAGAITDRGEVAMTVEALSELVSRAGTRVRVAFEVGGQSGWVSDELHALGHKVIVANSFRLKVISQSNRKSDQADAELLARFARADPELLCPVRHRGKQARQDLQLLRSREALVSARVELVNHVRGAVKASGRRLPACSTASFHRKIPANLPRELVPAFQPLIEAIETLTQQIREYDARIAHACEHRYPETNRLRQVAGIGPITALCFLLTLDDPTRFHSSRMVGAYLGLQPRRRQSGDRDPNLGITKAGDEHLRRLLVNAAQYILGPFGPDTDLKRWGLELASRGGSGGKQRAVIAVARKLAVLLHALWVSGEDYEPLRQASASEARRSA